MFSTVGDIMSTVEGYLEYCGGVQYHGGIHDAHGLWGDTMIHLKFEYRGGIS